MDLYRLEVFDSSTYRKTGSKFKNGYDNPKKNQNTVGNSTFYSITSSDEEFERQLEIKFSPTK